MAVYKKIFWGGLFLLFSLCFISGDDTCLVFEKASAQASQQRQEDMNINYRKSMIDLIEQISVYAKDKNNSFQLIQNAGLSLFEHTPDKSEERLLKQVDGVLMEGLYYTWRLNDFQRTNGDITRAREAALKIPQQAGLTILNIDYCPTVAAINTSLHLNEKNNIIGFAAQSRSLDRIPKYPWQLPNENDTGITSLNQAGNFLALLNPGRFPAKQRYLTYLQDTNYDLLIIDLNYKDAPLLPEDVAFLKKKKNGASRLVFAYMSIGEAESYRSYWQESWNTNPPSWIDELNQQWEGNFKVKYWSEEWRKILFGSDNSYLDTILAAGFDGVFMDVVDAYDYFEQKQQAVE